MGRSILRFVWSICILLPVSGFAQTVAGRITDSCNRPVVGAFVVLVNSDSLIICSSFSDSAGYYNIACSQDSALFVEVFKIGFESAIRRSLPHANLDFVLLNAVEARLEDVTIRSKVPTVEYRSDRTIFNVEGSIASAGGDALEILRRTPGVVVSDNSISIAGRGGAVILIDGKLQQLRGFDLIQLLRSIPADNISRIEIIHAPSSRYDAEGADGVINIILKKNRQKGFRGSLTGSNEYNSALNFPTASLAIGYKKGNLNLFCNANGGRQGHRFSSYVDSYYPTQHAHQEVTYPYLNSTFRVQFGGDYSLGKKATLGFSFNEAFNRLRSNESINASFFNRNGELDSCLNSRGLTLDRYPGKLTANLNYGYRLDTNGGKMTIDLDYFRQRGNRQRDFSAITADRFGASGTEYVYRISGFPLTDIRSLKVDLEKPLRVARFFYGAKVSDVYNDMNSLYETVVNGRQTTDTQKSDNFKYREVMQALYVNAAKSYKKLEITMGIRAERFDGTGISDGVSNRVRYVRFFPSISMRYEKNANHAFGLNFGRRINRPGYSALNPVRFYYTLNSFEQGNPALQPSFAYRSECAYTYRSKLNLRAQHTYVWNYYDSRVAFVDTVNNTSAFTMRNIGRRQYINLSASYSAKPLACWELLYEIGAGFSNFVPFDQTGIKQYSGYYWTIEGTNSFMLNKKRSFSAELNAYYYSPRQRDYVHWAGMSSVSLGVKCMMLKKKLAMTIFASDIFAGSRRLQTNKLNNTVEYSYSGNTLRLALSYRFGSEPAKRRQEKSNEEIQRAN